MIHLLVRYFLSRLIFIGWLIVTASPLLLIMWLVRDDEKLRSTLLWVVAPLGLVSAYSAWWLASTTSTHLFEENRAFLDSVKHTLYDLRVRLAFLPIVGTFFTPDEDASDLRDDDP